jgi:hypothetical protein
VQELGSPRPERRGRRRARPVEPGDPSPVSLTVVTVTGEHLADEAEGSNWLKAVSGNRERGAEEIRAATRIVNRALSAVRAGARDPLVHEIGASRALVIRIGHGSGDQLAEGLWTEASELPRPRRGRLDTVDSQSRVAAVLAGRDEVHPAETLMLRARLDAEQGRDGEAVYGLRAARAAIDELPAASRKKLLEQLAEIEKRLEERSG